MHKIKFRLWKWQVSKWMHNLPTRSNNSDWLQSSFPRRGAGCQQKEEVKSNARAGLTFQAPLCNLYMYLEGWIADVLYRHLGVWHRLCFLCGAPKPLQFYSRLSIYTFHRIMASMNTCHILLQKCNKCRENYMHTDTWHRRIYFDAAAYKMIVLQSVHTLCEMK